MTEGRFDDKVALITGAASGMGRATAVRLASEGARIYGIDVNAEGLEATEQLVAAEGSTMTSRVTDIRKRDECHAAVESCKSDLGKLDVVANVAGVLRLARLADVTEDDLDFVFSVNVNGTYWMCQAAIPHLLENRGNIVNVASNAGLMGQAYATVYGSSKAAVVNLTRCLAMEFAKERVRINCVAPGGVETPMTVGEVSPLPDDVDFDLVRPVMGFRRMASPEQLAAVIAFVASDEARQMHGSIVSADAGLTAG
jgi:meso-butanediol dehydrogenase/(S,S)-butanediol dehydrogenase/diacetyl reductase